MTTSSYTVVGMTCGHCVSSVSEEIRALPTVSEVVVVLDTGTLTVTSEHPLEHAAVAAAVEEAGCQLVPAEGDRLLATGPATGGSVPSFGRAEAAGDGDAREKR